MDISRRALLWRLGAGAAVGAAVPSLAHAASGDIGDLAPERTGLIRLHRNENAAGPSPSAVAAVRAAASRMERYPEVDEEALRVKLATLHRVPSSNIVVGCGSSDILRMACECFAGRGRNVVIAAPAFGVMAEAAVHAGAAVVAVPLTSAHTHDLEAMLRRIDPDTGLVYVSNPNNPTGTLTRRRDLESFVRYLPASVRVVIDEAYHHYAGDSSEYASFIDHPIGDDGVIITRTFSAIHGLAGLRIGYAVAEGPVASQLSARRPSPGVSSVAALAAAAALDDVEHVRTAARQNADDRQEFLNQANARMLRAMDSHANFVMLNTERNAAEIVEHFRRNGVLVAGPFAGYPTYIRVSLGAPDEIQAFWRVWDLLPMGHMSM